MTHTEPPYLRIVNEIRRRIDTGELAAGERVPSTRQITQDWGVAMATATKVLNTLRQQGLVTAVAGVGTVVRAQNPTTPTKRADHATLTRDRVVATAIAIADTEGIDAVSMRRVATDLDAATMTLYNHVRNKDELVILMLDAAYAELDLPEPPPRGWRAQLEQLARAQWDLCRRHTWLARHLSLTRPQPLPNAFQLTERALRALAGCGLDPTATLYTYLTLINYVRGTAINLETEAADMQDTGLTADEWMDTQEDTFAEILGPAAMPAFATLLNSFGGEGFDFTVDTLFEFGLRLLLDGIAHSMLR